MQVLKGHTDAVCALAFAPDGRSLASLGQATGLYLWDLSGGEPRAALGSGAVETSHAVAFSPDGALVAATLGSHFTVFRADDPQAVLFTLPFFAPQPILFHPRGL